MRPAYTAVLLGLALVAPGPGGQLPAAAQVSAPAADLTAAEPALQGDRVLRRGQWGGDVFRLQRLLMQLGLMESATGYFGVQTEAAVRRLQEALGLTPDGLVGPATAGALALFTEEVVYPVAPGDSLWSIARRFGLTMDAILLANHLESARVRPGDKLILPGLHRYRVVPGDTLTALAARFDTATRRLAEMNQLDPARPLAPGAVLIVPAPRW